MPLQVYQMSASYTRRMQQPTPLRTWLLLTVVFCTGACVLILEILSTRIFAPYFGNTIFAFSSIIGVTLVALSIGYYAGGRLADARPYGSWFFAIIVLAGASVFTTKLLSVTLLAWYANHFSLVWGPLVFAIALFTVPCVHLGMLSPYAIRLLQSTQSSEGIGSLSGTVFFWSTLGSIAGTFFAGFLLIPLLGVQSILLSLGTFLLCLGGIGLIVNSRSQRVLVFLLLCFALSALVAFLSMHDRPANIVYAEEGLYESIVVHDTNVDGRTVRFLRQNANLSSAIDRATGDLFFEYSRYYQLPLALHPAMQRALVIGAGAFSIPQAIVNASSATVDAVDPEPHLREIARRYFGVEESDRLRTHVADGRSFLRGTEGRYDLIFSDAYQNFHSIPPHLLTREFFETARSALSDRGVFVVNFIGRMTDERPSLLWSAVRTFKAVFPQSSFFAVDSLETTGTQNIIFVGCGRAECADPCTSILRSRATSFLRKACAQQLSVDAIDVEHYALLTDDYVPVEYLAARSL